jgi:hypothetical protein
MGISHSHRALGICQEGSDARATTGRLDFLFPDSEAQKIGEAYDRLVLMVDSQFAQRWETIRGASVAPEALHEMVQEITLHWMYFCAVNHLALQIGHAEWEHPQTRRIIRSAVKRNLQPDSTAETQVCAHLMGISEAEYLQWREADEAFLSIM